MSNRKRARSALFGALLLGLLVSAPASAVPFVTVLATDLGGGLFQYDLTLHNAGGAEPLSGLNVLHANSVFGLTAGSTISAPAGWSHFAPLPPFVDELNFFSLTNPSDVAVDASLAGFSFQSTTGWSSVATSFEVEGIGGTTSSQIPFGNAIVTPEPGTAVLLAVALAVQAALRRRRLL